MKLSRQMILLTLMVAGLSCFVISNLGEVVETHRARAHNMRFLHVMEDRYKEGVIDSMEFYRYLRDCQKETPAYPKRWREIVDGGLYWADPSLDPRRQCN